MKYVTVQEMISIEKAADVAGCTYGDMMEAAGKGLAEEIQSRYHGFPNKSVTALVGSGNNGGDALVALDYLQTRGWKSTVLLCRERSQNDALLNRFLSGGGRLVDWTTGKCQVDEIDRELSGAELILDGVLGTGIRLPLREPIRTILSRVKERLSTVDPRPIVVAVDCPSGLDCDSGEVDPACIPADLTVTMAAIKKGLLEFPAYQYLGELCLVEIGLPVDLPEFNNIPREVITKDWVRSVIPERSPAAHKGVFGTALIIAGSVNYPGSVLLAGKAAYRSGAGLVTLAVPGSIYSGLIGALPEATWIRLDDAEGYLTRSGLTQIESALGRPTACLVGPGLGSEKTTADFLESLFALDTLPPLVLDADGLRHARGLTEWPHVIPVGSILTPHPGEMSTLTGLSVAEIQADRLGIAERFSREWNQIVLLKGAHTLIAEPGGRTKIYQGGDPALARAGSGDVLAGVITGLLAQGVSPFEAAAAGVWIHGQAGKLAAKKKGSPAAVLAGDIIKTIGSVLPGG